MSDFDTQTRMDDNRRPEEIENDLERTRAEMSSTLDAIQQKLSPGQMMDQALTYARTSLPAEFGSNLGNAVRSNPVPVALVGIGLAWLAASSRNSHSGRFGRDQYDPDHDHMYTRPYAGATHSSGMHDERMHGAVSSVSAKGAELKDRASEAGRNVMGKASDIGQRIGESASSMTDHARGITQQASERVSATAQQARMRAAELGQRSQQQYYRAKDGVVRTVDEQPLMVGVFGLAIGALLGAVLPSTRREDEMMGRTRDDLLDKAKATASEQAERVKASAQHVADVARQEATTMADNVTSSVQGGTHASKGADAGTRDPSAGASSGAASGHYQSATNSGVTNSAATSGSATGVAGKPTSPNVKVKDQHDEIPVDEAHM